MSKATLYHIPFYSSTPAVLAVHELGITDKVEVRLSTDGAHKAGEVGAANPHGFVPLLASEAGDYLIESGAILLHLVETHGGKDHAFLGTPEQRAKLLQWLFYGPATFYPKISPPFMDASFKADAAKMAELRASFEKTSHAMLEESLKDSDYLLGNNFTVADMMMGYYVFCLGFLGWIDASTHPKIAAYYARLQARPSWQLTFPAM